MEKIKWFFKQLLPLWYHTNYWENGKHYHCDWKMWFGKTFNVTDVKVLGE